MNTPRNRTRFAIRAATTLALAATIGTAAVRDLRAQPAPALVSTQWLADHLDDPNLVVLHVAWPNRDLEDGVIRGARRLNYRRFAIEQHGLTIEIPPVEQLEAALGEIGVSNDTRVILYSSGSAHMPARIYMTLDYLGHGDRTSVLDGGLEMWMAEDRPRSDTPVTGPAGTFTAHVRNDVLVDADWIAEHLDDPRVTLIDARPEGEYTGEEPWQDLRTGHIPGAYNLFWPELQLSEERPMLRPVAEARARFEEAGASRDGLVVSYCLVGMRASYTYLIAKHLGYHVRFYDGSWNEWGARTELPAVKGKSRR